ncbi:MAG TPA: acyl-CoA desaturase [Candidatus Paceibacterota bacterium]
MKGLTNYFQHEFDWIRAWPFVIAHGFGVYGIYLLSIDWTHNVWLWWAAFLYAVRMFSITAVYHRYFSHRSYQTNRLFQFIFALLGVMSVQKGPLWWAGWHRHHHRYSDQPKDVHSPRQRGFWYSHIGWVLARKTNYAPVVKDPDLNTSEIRFLDQWHYLPPIVLGTIMFYIGGMPSLCIGFFLSTVFLWHGTFFVNSLAHVIGTQRFATGDDSRNNFWLAFLTCGEGWHNNHHQFQWSVRQGLFWTEIDVSYYILKFLSLLGIVWDLKIPTSELVQKTMQEKPGGL